MTYSINHMPALSAASQHRRADYCEFFNQLSPTLKMSKSPENHRFACSPILSENLRPLKHKVIQRVTNDRPYAEIICCALDDNQLRINQKGDLKVASD